LLFNRTKKNRASEQNKLRLLIQMIMSTTNSASKWMEAPPSRALKDWFVGGFGVVMVVITVIALMTDSAFFVVSLVLTLCGVGYLVYRQIDQANLAARTLHDSEQRFRLLVDEVYDYAIFGLDPQGRVMSWNAGAERMLGYQPDHILKEAFNRLCVNEKEGGLAADQALAKAVKEGRVQVECWLARRDGSRFLSNIVITPMEGDDGRLRGFSVIASDITARKEAEEVLNTSHRFIQRVMAAVPDLLFIVELGADKFVFLNDTVRGILGYSKETLEKSGPVDLTTLMHAEDLAGVENLRRVSATLKDGEVHQFEARLHDSAGEWRWFSFRSVVFARNDTGEATQALCLAQDLTVLKRAQEDVRRFEQVALSRERLALLGELSASVAHEFRNPLLGVQHCMEELRNRCADRPDLTDLVNLLGEGLVRMDHVSGRLLRLARSDDGVAELADLGACIDGTVGFVRSHAQKAGVQLHTQVEPNLPKVPLFAERLSEALLNLIYNAIDACEHGGSVTIQARQRPNVKKIEVSVSDTGAGIPKELREKIFEAFFTTKAPGRGTGLGMTIVRRIVEAHRGSIEIGDQEAKGTTFRILLPMTEKTEG
jgi:PAS domain S-box-containing protein